MASQDNTNRGNPPAEPRPRSVTRTKNNGIAQPPRQEVQDQLTGTSPGVPGGPGSWQSDSAAEARNKAAIAGQRQSGQGHSNSKP